MTTPERIQFKIAVMTYRVLYGEAPRYLGRSPLLLMSLVDGRCVLPEPIGWLCLQLDFPPSVAELFRLPPLKSGTLPEHIVSAPTLQSFRRHLKTCLLQQSFCL